MRIYDDGAYMVIDGTGNLVLTGNWAAIEIADCAIPIAVTGWTFCNVAGGISISPNAQSYTDDNGNRFVFHKLDWPKMRATISALKFIWGRK